jgi:hypothetical protein
MRFDTVTRVQIHLRKRQALKAALALYSQGKIGFWAIFSYTGPDFIGDNHPDPEMHTGLEVATGHTTVNVVTGYGAAEYVYPLSTVVRIKIVA